MAAQTTTIETVTVVRPLKVIALICMVVALALLIVSLATTNWLSSDSLKIGLFWECGVESARARLNPVSNAPKPGQCQEHSRDASYIIAVIVLLIIACVATFFGIIMNVLGLRGNDLHKKYIFYKATTCLIIFAVFLELTSLIIFPVCFYVRRNDYGVRNWDFDWSYGIAWGATVFSFAASLLMICDKEHEDIYYKEKTMYNPPPEFT
ncbi:hypothetical protein QR680_001415 [Steinernema hermaphroditum]|uniref:Uncharacterized protein n=1 Tax=Steinernema hermaphroditum TaxID=289476 RepID=A0AA39GY82_9BILA|nr:hypothetical protein QR680_001415 [Steinernema hermaphroditum]